jgi:hypothetical protein
MEVCIIAALCYYQKSKTLLVMYKALFLLPLIYLFCTGIVQSQPDRWQQGAEYEMDIQFDVNTHRFSGTQKLVYYNNSPDELDRAFYHLYFNAFQPNSMMDVRSRTIVDPDSRVGGRIARLNPNQIGYLKVKSLKMDGKAVEFEEVGTILEVSLPKSIPAESKAVFEMTFEGQVPLQIRRSGRDNAEGVAYSMAQWYPKMCEYDYQGWHANPYVGREFHGIWGDFDVKITIDRDYTIAATGYLQNPEQIGHGYLKDKSKLQTSKGDKLTWHFKAPKVHDFVWSADDEYTHTMMQAEDGPMMHFFYKKNENTEDAWSKAPAILSKAFPYINAKFGKYPYEQYSFIQGGDGGMEYPMATLITGNRSLPSLVGVSIHELMHSWYQMILGTNESLYSWMDEGFTSYASSLVMNYLRAEGLLPGRVMENPHRGAYIGYINFSQSKYEEPMITHADHFVTNQAYSVSSYVKGAVFLGQLKYMMGKETFEKGMLSYFDNWKFKHPNYNDFIRIMEKQSGLELDWYKEYWVHTTHTIDYAVDSLYEKDGEAQLVLRKKGIMPMPLDVQLTAKDGRQWSWTIPLRIMRGHKPLTDGMILAEDWPWTHPIYTLSLPVSMAEIEKIEIDPDFGMADVDRSNNLYGE